MQNLQTKLIKCLLPFSSKFSFHHFPKKCAKYYKSFSTVGDKAEIIHKKIKVLNYDINYVEMDGNSDHVLFILPGSLSSIELDFVPLLRGLDPQRFKAICWDPPGQGRSRPPNRWDIEGIVSEKDVPYAIEFINKLGYKKYSLLGWSSGGFTSVFMSVLYPEQIRSLIIWGVNAYWDDYTDLIVKLMQKAGVSSMPKQRFKQLLAIYGKEDLTKMFNKWLSTEDIDTLKKEFFKGDGIYPNNFLKKISVPTLIVHGAKDKFVHVDQAKFVHECIKNSELRILQNGNHIVHGPPTEAEFLKSVQDFLTKS